MPAQRPFKVGDVVVTRQYVVTSQYVDDCGPDHVDMGLPAGTVAVLTWLDEDLWSATLPTTGAENVLFYEAEIAHPEDLTDG